MLESIINYFKSFVSSDILVYQYSIWPAIIAAIGSLGAAGLGLASQSMTNKKNKQATDEANAITKQNNLFQQQAYLDEQQYNRALQERTFEREDTSYQRTVNDITKAGYSPLAINGTNDSGSIVGNAQMPELSAINPFQAQSLNFGQLADVLAKADERAIDRERLNIEKEKNLSDTEQKKLDRQQRKDEFEANLAQRQDEFNQNIDLAIKKFEAEDKATAQKLKNEKEHITLLNEQLKFQQDKETTRKIEAQMQALTNGKGHTKRYTNKDDYDKAFAKWCDEWATQLGLAAQALQSPTLESNGHNEGKSLGSKAILDASYSEGNNNTRAYANSDKAQDTDLLKWLVNNPMPVYY